MATERIWKSHEIKVALSFGSVIFILYLCYINLKLKVMITIEQALKELQEKGADITKVNDNKYIVIDNGFFGFCEHEEPFFVDGDDILEIHEQYIS